MALEPDETFTRGATGPAEMSQSDSSSTAISSHFLVIALLSSSAQILARPGRGHAQDESLLLFPGEFQDSLANRRRDPKLGFLFQLLEQRAHPRNQSRSPGLEQDAENPNRFDS